MKYTAIRRVATGILAGLVACAGLANGVESSGTGSAELAEAGNSGTGRGGGARGEGRRKGGASNPSFTFQTEVPAHPIDLVLGRPTATSVTVSILAYEPIQGQIRYGSAPDHLSQESPEREFAVGEPAAVVLAELSPDTAYYYQFVAARADGQYLPPLPVSRFHTQRRPGRPFSFAVQADSHLDGATNPAVYQATLNLIGAGQPDFMIDLGDTFMNDKHADRVSAYRQYLAQRYYFGSVCHSLPLFLVLGNHDGEQGRLAGGPESLAVWSNGMRTRCFPNPVPDGFYSGNSQRDPYAGLLENYYAWTWGDALFVVLDPFWYSMGRGNESAWMRTLGEAQYRWLAETLSSSKAAHRFVFIHHLTGGADRNARGGAEASRLYEWGGHEADGADTFAANRPGWPMPIHALLVEHGVSIVFHGHDHFFMKQERDGVVYQLVPQPGHKGAGSSRSAAEYGYLDGDIVSGSGHVRVHVAPERATVEFLRTPVPGANGGAEAAELAYSYSVSAR